MVRLLEWRRRAAPWLSQVYAPALQNDHVSDNTIQMEFNVDPVSYLVASELELSANRQPEEIINEVDWDKHHRFRGGQRGGRQGV